MNILQFKKKRKGQSGHLPPLLRTLQGSLLTQDSPGPHHGPQGSARPGATTELPDLLPSCPHHSVHTTSPCGLPNSGRHRPILRPSAGAVPFAGTLSPRKLTRFNSVLKCHLPDHALYNGQPHPTQPRLTRRTCFLLISLHNAFRL